MDLYSFIENDPPKVDIPKVVIDDPDPDLDILKDYKEFELSKVNINRPRSHVMKVDTCVVDVLYDIECIVDRFMENHFQGNIPIFTGVFRDRVKKTHVKDIRKSIEFSFNEYNELLTTTDADLLDAYSNLTKYEIKKLADIYRSVLEICDKIDTPVIKKVRKKKEVPPSKLVSKMKICDKYDPLSLVSINTENIIGATQLWVFDTKTYMVGCYYSQDGLSVKGTSVINFNVETSFQKKLRMSKENLTIISEGGNVIISKMLDKLKTQAKPLSGRISDNIILLRVNK